MGMHTLTGTKTLKQNLPTVMCPKRKPSSQTMGTRR